MPLSSNVLTLLRANVLKVMSSLIKSDGQLSLITFKISDINIFNNFRTSKPMVISEFMGCCHSCSSCICKDFCIDETNYSVKFFGVIKKEDMIDVMFYSSKSLYTKIYFNHHEV